MNCFGIDDALKLIWITFRSLLACVVILLMYQSDPHRSQTSGHVEKNKRRERTRRNKKLELYRELYITLLHELRDARLISSTPPNACKI